MKYGWFLILFLITPVVSGQLCEDFEDGHFRQWTPSAPGRWVLDSIQPLEGRYSLHHGYDNSSAGHDQISIPINGLSWESDSIVWSFMVKHTYNPSSANNWSVFLVSDKNAGNMFPGGSAEAIVAGVNFTGSDDLFKLWYLKNGTPVVLYTTGLNWQDSIGTSAAGIRIARYRNGTWHIYISPQNDNIHWLPAGHIVFTETFPANYTGIYYEYSSAQDRKLWFDKLKINGVFIPDTIPPEITGYRIPEAKQISVSFSEDVKPRSAEIIPSLLLEPYNIYSVNYSFITPDSILFTLSDSLAEDQDYRLTVTNLTDLSGNAFIDSTTTVVFHPGSLFDIVINEIMADPIPPLGLPEAEYIELFNRSSYNIWMDHWTITLGEKKIDIPGHLMESQSYVILCSAQDEDLFNEYGKTLPVQGFPSLHNEGMPVTLRNEKGYLIHHIRYDHSWYGDASKAEGGWSLEQIDPMNPCPRKENWSACARFPGGTPGTQNSQYVSNPDFSAPGLTNIYLVGDSVLRLYFSEMYDTVKAMSPQNYEVDHDVGYPEKVLLHPPDYIFMDLQFARNFQSGILYTLNININFTDCSGNPLEAPLSFSFALPAAASPSDIIINEILFNPHPGGSDYVELFNRSTKVFDLSRLLAARRSASAESLTDINRVTYEPRLFLPGTFILLTEDPENVASLYPVSNPKVFLGVDKMPPMPDTQGNIIITDSAGSIIDEVDYDENMQFTLLTDPEGVALERLRYNEPSNDPANWHSASTVSGYGTPGLPNSQSAERIEETSSVQLDPEIISPDNDGYHDYLSIHYHFNKPGETGRILIYNSRGVPVRKLCPNQLLGVSGTFIWDGLDDYGKKLPSGIYLIWFETVSPEGKVKRYKKVCVLAWK